MVVMGFGPGTLVDDKASVRIHPTQAEFGQCGEVHLLAALFSRDPNREGCVSRLESMYYVVNGSQVHVITAANEHADRVR